MAVSEFCHDCSSETLTWPKYSGPARAQLFAQLVLHRVLDKLARRADVQLHHHPLVRDGRCKDYATSLGEAQTPLGVPRSSLRPKAHFNELGVTRAVAGRLARPARLAGRSRRTLVGPAGTSSRRSTARRTSWPTLRRAQGDGGGGRSTAGGTVGWFASGVLRL